MPFPFNIKSDKPLEDYTLDELQNGVVILVDKPLEWTSFQVVNKLKYFFKRKFSIKKIKIGHAGTLDPLATGLLVICIGKATKQIESFQSLTKVYSGTIQLGGTTSSYDLETEIDQSYPTDHIKLEDIVAAQKAFSGTITQIPPIYSALKVDGQRAYKKARKGEDVKILPRNVEIHTLELKFDEANKQIAFLVECSKGTYIRTLAYDIGKFLKSGSYLSELRRNSIGHFNI